MRLLISLVIAVLLGLVASASAQAINRPTWTGGDTWTIRQGTETTTFAVLGPAGDGYAVQVKTSSDSSILHYDGNLAAPNAHFFRLMWPLERGKQWRYQATFRDHTYDITETVIGPDSVSVPAGSFEAVRIRGKHCYSALECGMFDLWYAPSVKFVVKVTFSSGYWLNPNAQELVSYQVH